MADHGDKVTTGSLSKFLRPLMALSLTGHEAHLDQSTRSKGIIHAADHRSAETLFANEHDRLQMLSGGFQLSKLGAGEAH